MNPQILMEKESVNQSAPSVTERFCQARKVNHKSYFTFSRKRNDELKLYSRSARRNRAKARTAPPSHSVVSSVPFSRRSRKRSRRSWKRSIVLSNRFFSLLSTSSKRSEENLSNSLCRLVS